MLIKFSYNFSNERVAVEVPSVAQTSQAFIFYGIRQAAVRRLKALSL